MCQRFNLNLWTPLQFQFLSEFFYFNFNITDFNFFLSYLSQLLPDLRFTYESLLVNRQCWLIFDQILQKEGVTSGELDYLRDVELEKRVFEQLNKQNFLAKTIKEKNEKLYENNSTKISSTHSIENLSIQSETSNIKNDDDNNIPEKNDCTL